MVPPLDDKQYGVSKEEESRIRRRAEMRDVLKREYRKQITNPHIYAKGEGGYVFDPAIQRYMSMHATMKETFKPTVKNFGVFMGMCVIPIGTLWWYLYTSKQKFERKCRNGEIAYKDRLFMFK